MASAVERHHADLPMSRYAAFISYAGSDAAWARWLLRRLESFRVPTRLVGTQGRFGPIGPRLGRVFRDRDELPSSGDLGATIRTALGESDALIVVCSPAAARSRWVAAEIEAFRELHDSEVILCLVVDGDPAGTDGGCPCFPPGVLAAGKDGRLLEPLAADARREGDGRERAFLKLVAGLLGVGFDVLVQRHAQQRHRRMALVAALALAGMAITSGLAVTAHLARDDARRRQAQAEDLLGFMLGDLREKLSTVGRLDLMRTVDDKATEYFAALDARDISDRALAEQGRSLTGIGEVRLAEGRHEEAMQAFEQAHARMRTLAERSPDGQRLFDLAQAQYWIGLTRWRQNRFDEARAWLTRYLDSGKALAAMDPDRFDWQLEVAYGHHNLAVLANSLAQYAEAERIFLEERELYAGWVAARPDDVDLRWWAADVDSWLGTMGLRQGKLTQAAARFAAARDALLANRVAQPKNATWQIESVNQRILLAEALALRGDRVGARAQASAALPDITALAGQDPSNQNWQVTLAVARWWTAQLAGDHGSAIPHAAAAEAILAGVHAAEPRDARALGWLVKSRLLLADLAYDAGADADASRWIEAAGAVLMPAWADTPAERLRLALAALHLRRGLLSARAGATDAAQQDWVQSYELLTDGGDADPPFERLDLLARTLRLLGRDSAAARYEQRLAEAGYQPLRPLTLDAMPTADQVVAASGGPDRRPDRSSTANHGSIRK